MATITPRYVSTKDYAPFYLRLEHKGKRFNAPTKLYVHKEFFKNHYKAFLKLSVKQLQAKKNDPNIDKCLEYQNILKPLIEYVLNELVNISDEEYSTTFLKRTITTYYNSGEQNPERLNVTYWLQYKINNPHKFKGKKGKIGLAENTVKNAKGFLKKIEKYEKVIGRKLKLNDLNQDGINEFNVYLTNLVLKDKYKRGLIIDLKKVGEIARAHGKIELSKDFYLIETPLIEDAERDVDVIYLTQPEIDKIVALDLKNPALINARKWFLLGIYTGQRGGDLLNRVLPNIDLKNKTIKIRQEKTFVKVTIPIHPILKGIIKNPPYKISKHTLIPHIKKLGKLAGLDELIKAYKQTTKEIIVDGKTEKVRRSVLDTRPKYEYLATHTCRRTFCMMYYDSSIAREDIMLVSGHSTLDTFLKYINKTDDRHVEKYEKFYANNN